MPEVDRHDRSVDDAVRIWKAGLAAVDPLLIVDRGLLERIAGRRRSRFTKRYVVVGCGKAALSLASAIESAAKRNPDLLEPSSLSGIVTVPKGYRDTLPKRYEFPESISVIEGAHPTPDQSSVDAVNRTISFLKHANLSSDDCVIALISGGGSATWAAPIDGLSLDELVAFTDHELRDGGDIIRMNVLRRLLTKFGSGGLLQFTGAARVEALIISDVPTSDLSIVASGPTHLPPAGLSMISEGSYPMVSSNMIALGNQRAKSLTGAAVRARVTHHLLADNRSAIAGALREAQEVGYPTPSTLHLSGEARQAGSYLTRMLTRLSRSHSGPLAIIAGGETTVRVVGSGKGGRNQECVIASCREMDSTTRKMVVLCGGTDGIDGPTAAAGGWVTERTLMSLESRGLLVDAILDRNDSHTALSKIDSLVLTGPTHTNVMDLAVCLVASD